MNSSVQYNDNNEAFDNKKQHPWWPFHTILKPIYTHKVPNHTYPGKFYIQKIRAISNFSSQGYYNIFEG